MRSLRASAWARGGRLGGRGGPGCEAWGSCRRVWGASFGLRGIDRWPAFALKGIFAAMDSSPRAGPRALAYDLRDYLVMAAFTMIVGGGTLAVSLQAGHYRGLFDAESWRWRFDPTPLLTAPPIVFLHLLAGLGCLGSAAAIFALRKGSPLHKKVGWAFSILVVVAVTTSVLTHSGPLTGAQLGALSALGVIPFAIWSIRRGDVRRHRTLMALISILCLMNTVLGFLPGRTMHTVFFSDRPPQAEPR